MIRKVPSKPSGVRRPVGEVFAQKSLRLMVFEKPPTQTLHVGSPYLAREEFRMETGRER
jgi:hypothetical protein